LAAARVSYGVGPLYISIPITERRMKRRYFVLFACICCGLLLLSGDGLAQQPVHMQTAYGMSYIAIADTKPQEYIWLVDGAASVVYKSLASPSLLTWVTQLPKGTETQYMVSYVNRPKDDIPAFGRFCHSKGIKFQERFDH
jgi:hypothetical protein